MADMNGKFLAGFGMTDITPEDSVPMASYGDDLRRFSEGQFTPLQARAVAITDETGESLIFVVGDLSWAPAYLCTEIFENIEKELGVPKSHVVLSGTHTHASVAANHDHLPEICRYHVKYIAGMTEAAKLAFADRKPAKIFCGSVMTQRMNFVRRYIMDDGSLIGDNAYGTGTVIVGHETLADGQLQLTKLVREGGADILLSNFQAHPHLEGKTKFLSYQTVGAFRAEMERRLGIHCLHWQGAAGNINTHSRIQEENRTKDRDEWAGILADYAMTVYDDMKPVESGNIGIADTTYIARVHHAYDHKVAEAEQIRAYFRDGHTAKEAAAYAHTLGINSYYHAVRIVANSKLPETKEIYLRAFKFGGISGVITPYEMFDTNGMFIKANTPFDMTFIVGYSWPSYCGYIPSAQAWKNGGYECDNTMYAPGTGEELAEHYLELLKQLHA